MPNAAISLTKTDNGQIRRFSSDNQGQFTAPDLAIGSYTVDVQATGFKAVTQNVVLAVGDRLRLNFKLEVGRTEEHVTVEATTVQVQTDTGEISDLISGRQITQLATNGRSIYTLVNLTPGASSLQGDFQTPTPVGGDANVSFNGARPAHNIYLLDGGENLDRGGAGTFSVMPSLESLSEFRALTSNYSAEYGLSSAATMTTVLKSGTKGFHASAWEFVRNDALNARPFFTPVTAKIPELRFNTWGFNVGGPVTFGKLYNSERKKTFFFYNMEWRSLIQGGTLNQTVPLPSTYGGNFGSTLINVPTAAQLSPAQQARLTGAGLTLGSPFPNNTIPASLLDPNAQTLLKAGIFPAPTTGAQFRGGSNAPTNVREETTRIDHQFSDKFSVFGHFIAEQISQGFGTTQWSGDNVPTVGDTFGNPSYSAVVHTTHIISPKLLNEVAFNYNGNRINIIPNGVVTAPSAFGFNRVFTGPNDLTRIPSINLSKGTGANYTSNWTPWKNVADDYQLRDDLSWTKGKHQIKMGASWALYKKVQNLFANTQGNFTFDGSYTGNDFADFLLGYAQQYTEDAVKDSGHWNNVSWALYIQDNWRFNNRLTLNLGLRWDGAPHTYEANNRMSNFYPNLYNPTKAATLDPTNSNVILPTSPALGGSPNSILAGYQFYLNGVGISGQPGVPHGMVQDHWLNFGPRLGFAYDLTGDSKTVVRGGFGIMYERVQGNDMYNAGGNVPFSATLNFKNVLLSNPKTGVQTGTTITAPPLPILVPGITGLASNNYASPTSYQYSFSIQRSLASRTVLQVAYVGSQNRHQSDFHEINLPAFNLLPTLSGSTYNTAVPFQGFAGIRLAMNEGNSHYNALQVDLHSTMKDLSLQFGYTYSKSIDPTTGGGNGFDLDNVSNPYVGWRYDNGPSIFDRTHVAFVNFDYQIPVFRNNDSRLIRSTLGGWALAGIVTMETGAPINITWGGAGVNKLVPNSANRPNLVAPVSYPGTVAQWFSTASFAGPAAGMWGNLGHNALRGPGRDNWNLSLSKIFTFTESSHFEFRAETFNTFNHTQFKGDVQNGGISTSVLSSTFGQITSAYDPRTMQLGVKLVF